MADNAFEQIFGYNPVEEFQNTPAWRTERRASLSPAVDAQISYMGQQETNKANAELAQKQNDFNLMMWEKQNAYNSPAETMKRLTEAGINPRAYQQIGQFANAESPKPAERPDYESPLGKLARFTDKAQIDLARKKLVLEKINMSKDIATALTEKILSYQQLEETKRHNHEVEGYQGQLSSIGWSNSETNRAHKVAQILGQYGIETDFLDGKFKLSYDPILKKLPIEQRKALKTEVITRISKMLKEIEVLDTTKRKNNAEAGFKESETAGHWYDRIVKLVEAIIPG